MSWGLIFTTRTGSKPRRGPSHPHTPFHPAWYYEPFELPGRRMNASRGWEIYPQIIFDMAMRIKNDYRNIPWFVAESGMGVETKAEFRNREGVIDDSYRIRFISEHLWHTRAPARQGPTARAICCGRLPTTYRR